MNQYSTMALPVKRSTFQTLFGGLFLPILIATGFLLGGCQFEGSFEPVRCNTDLGCPADAVCLRGYCVYDDIDVGLNAGQPDDVGDPDVGDPDVGDPDVGDPDVGDADVGPLCPGEEVMCQGGCVDTNTDDAHCGQCQNACSGPDQTCIAGSCQVVCSGGQTQCGQACFDLDSNRDHCGSCNLGCDPGEVCDSGICQLDCEDGRTACDGSCVDLRSNPDHCNQCDNSCTTNISNAHPICHSSTCSFSCNTGFEECSGQCFDTDISMTHCGSCNDPCTTAVSNAQPLCDGGSCTFSCNTGYDHCDGQCLPLAQYQSDDDNCGGCGLSCDTGEFCDAGSCQEIPSCFENPDPNAPYYPFGQGDGSPSNPFAICTAAQLNSIGTTYHTYDFELFAHIDLDDLGATSFIPIGGSLTGFSGHFEGNDHIISNLHIDSTSNTLGLFRRIEAGGQVRNLTLVDVDVSGDQVIGGLVGALLGTVENITVSGTVIGTERIGGLFGATGGSSSQVINSHTDVDVYGTLYVGGLGGRNNGIISNCSASGDVVGFGDFVGGLAGINWRGVANNGQCNITNSLASGDVTALNPDPEEDDFEFVGGLVGSNLSGTCSISGSSASGTITADREVGGLAGYNSGSISDSSSSSTVVASIGRVGGLVGRVSNGGIVSNSHATGSAQGPGFSVGGLVGYLHQANSQIMTSTADVTITAGFNSGGLVGVAEGSITASMAMGTITGQGNNIGGLVGGCLSECSISRSSAAMTVNSPTGIAIGGLVGHLDDNAAILNSYATGSVTGHNIVGGLVGLVGTDQNSSPTITNAYALVGVSGSSGQPNLRGLVGYNFGTVTSSYWNEEVSGQTAGGAGTHLSQSAFGLESSFVGWPFDTIWAMSTADGRPLLILP